MSAETEPDFQFTAYTSAPYDEVWEIRKDDELLDLTGWTGLTLALKQDGGTHAVTLNQVSTAVQGVRPLTPLPYGLVRVRIDTATIAGVPAFTMPATLRGELRGTSPEGTVRRLRGVVCSIRQGA